MRVQIAFLLVCLIACSGYSQQFKGISTTNYSKDLLDRKFLAYEVIELDVASIQSALNARTNIHHIELKSKTINWDLSLTEFEMFKPDFYLSVGANNHIYKNKDRGKIRTFKVLSNSKRAGLSCLTIADNFFYGYIEEAGIRTFIEPLTYLQEKADPKHFIIYREKDIIEIPGIKCGADELEESKHLGEHEIERNINAQRAGCITVDVALACDKTIFDNKGGISNSEAFVIGVLNNVQTNYDNEFSVSIELNVATIFVATSTSTDPWNGINNINNHLDVHRTWANSGGYGGASYGVATAWTRKYTSGAIGIAWLAAVCTNIRYNVCSDFGGAAGLLRCLQAHELGHNFNAIHDAGGSGFIMAPSVSNSNSWSASSINSISNFAKSLGCVGICNGGEPPVAAFEGSPVTLCPNKTVVFKDLSFGFPNNWTWTFPGGTPSSSTQQNPVVQYKTSGVYDVTLKVSNAFGENTNTYKQYIEVLSNLTHSFNAYTIGKDLITLNNCIDADSYLWKFGDGGTSTEEEPTHVYTKDGTYSVELCASNVCSNICKTIKVVVVTPVTSSFTSDVQEGCIVQKIKFKNLSSSNCTAFNWSFPGGTPNISTDKEPIISYSSRGKFDVSLIASNSKYTSTKNETFFIRVESSPRPEFDIKALFGNEVEFINRTIDSILPLKYTYDWNFGDGSSSTEKSPTHIFTKSGNYKVCLKVNNTCGIDSLCKNVEILAVLGSAFEVNSTNGCLPHKVTLKNISTGATSYLWNFPGGNPTTSTDINPEVIYNQKGSYDINLISYNGKDSIVSFQKSIVIVNEKPVTQFNYTINKLKVKFNNLSFLSTNYLWKFGDNKTSTEESPEHEYDIEGEFDVELISMNECGESIFKNPLTLYLIPKVNFTPSVTTLCVGDYLNLIDLSSKDVNQWNWQIEGGSPSTSSEQNPKVIFNKIGDYTIKLTVKNSNGENSLTRTALIHVMSPVLCPKRKGKTTKIEPIELD